VWNQGCLTGADVGRQVGDLISSQILLSHTSVDMILMRTGDFIDVADSTRRPGCRYRRFNDAFNTPN